jgi:hypothetical protein
MKGQQRVKCSPSSLNPRSDHLAYDKRPVYTVIIDQSHPSTEIYINELDSGIGWHFLCENFFSALSSHLVQELNKNIDRLSTDGRLMAN